MKIFYSSLFVLLVSSRGSAQTPPDMLEQVLPGVLTIAVNSASPVKTAMGAASKSDRFERAYDRVLDLSDAKGSGSGFLLKREGRLIVVTNAHVVEMAQDGEIYAYSINQTRYKLKVIGGDSFYDIALLDFVEPNKPGPELVPLGLRPDDPRVGETVYALGNPLGEYPNSASMGIVSGRNRLLSGLTGRLGYLQHSASIIWGNSGGPLIDSSGRVVGVNTRIDIEDHGQAFLISQLNFALETSVAGRVIDGLLANNGRLKRAYLGLELTQTLQTNQFRKEVVTAPVIESVVSGGPAAGLSKFKGYRVDRIGTQSIRNLDEAMAAIEALKPNQSLEFELTKDSDTQTATIRTGELTEQNYMTLTNHVISTRSNFELSVQDGQVYLHAQHQPLTKVSGAMRINQVALGQKSSPAQTPQVSGIVAAGLIPERQPDREEDADPMLYRVNSTRDLGVALRLLFMAGHADLVVVLPNSDQPSVLRWSLSGDPHVIVRMLIS